MKIQSANTRNIYLFVPNNNRTEERYICPECSPSRKNSKEKVLAWNTQTNRGYCHHCNSAFFEYKPYEKKQYFVPQWKNITALTDKAVKWFTGRGISQKTLVAMQVYSDVEFMPQSGKEEEVICFPYFRDGEVVNIKYRAAGKKFKLVQGAELIFYNFDSLKEAESIIITEGEIDALTFIENGFKNVISVPNGANVKLDYLDDCIDIFDTIKEIYLCTDNDTKGIELRDEFVRRFGPEKCLLANFEDCKDANEYYLKYGGIKFKDFKCTRPVVKGVINVESLYNDIRTYFEEGVRKGLLVGCNEIDQFVSWITGRLCICTGWPSCFTKDQLIHTSQGVKPIKDIKIGDMVLSYSHTKKYNEYKRVNAVMSFKTHTDKLYKIKLRDGSEIKVTASHKFFTGSKYLQIEEILLSLKKK